MTTQICILPNNVKGLLFLQILTNIYHSGSVRWQLGEGNGKPLQYSCLENPRDGKPGGLPSMGSHRVRYDWSGLAAAADDKYSHRYEVISYCIFYWHFSEDYSIKHSFSWLMCIFLSSLEKCSVFWPLSIEFFFFWYWVIWTVYVFWILTHYQSYHLLKYFPIHYGVFLFLLLCKSYV